MTSTRGERADAARNRQAILLAVEELLTRHRPEAISMEQVAAAAGVGKGTIFHRFGSRMGLMHALIESRAEALREAVTTGPPPLGPGAEERERLLAFLDGVVDMVARNKGLLAALGHAVTTTQRRLDDHPVYRFWHDHLTGLLTALRPGLDADMTAHVLLATLNSEPILLLIESGQGDRLAATLRTLVEAVIDA